MLDTQEIPYKNYPILFVDDEDLAVVTFEHLFKNDFTIYTALNGEEALKILEAHPDIALVATDQRMPRICGLDLLIQVAQKYPKTINILLTAYSDLALVVGAINHGNLYRYIAKPYEEEFLKQIIVQGLTRYHYLTERERFYAENIESVKRANGVTARKTDKKGH